MKKYKTVCFLTFGLLVCAKIFSITYILKYTVDLVSSFVPPLLLFIAICLALAQNALKEIKEEICDECGISVTRSTKSEKYRVIIGFGLFSALCTLLLFNYGYISGSAMILLQICSSAVELALLIHNLNALERNFAK